MYNFKKNMRPEINCQKYFKFNMFRTIIKVKIPPHMVGKYEAYEHIKHTH